MKMRPKIDRHDYETKKGHVVRFLRQGAKVKVTIMFRGREMIHPEIGQQLLERLADEVEEIAKIENAPKLDGRNMTMVLSPVKEAVVQKQAQPTPPRHRGSRHEQAKPAEGAEAGGEGAEAADEAGESDEATPKPPRPIKVTRAEGG
jgi:translation initiation factor IF-3